MRKIPKWQGLVLTATAVIAFGYFLKTSKTEIPETEIPGGFGVMLGEELDQGVLLGRVSWGLDFDLKISLSETLALIDPPVPYYAFKSYWVYLDNDTQAVWEVLGKEGYGKYCEHIQKNVLEDLEEKYGKFEKRGSAIYRKHSDAKSYIGQPMRQIELECKEGDLWLSYRMSRFPEERPIRSIVNEPPNTDGL